MDAQKILDQLMGTGKSYLDKSGYAGQGKGLATGGLAGTALGYMLGSKSGRKLGKKAAGYGGLALIAGLAYKAWQSHSANAAGGGQAAPGAGQQGAAQQPGSFGRGVGEMAGGAPWGGSRPAEDIDLIEPPRESPFNPAAAPGGAESRAEVLLVAMISAAKADGHIDAEEQRRIFGRLDELALENDEKAFVMDQLRAPLDVDRVVRLARGPEEALEVYAASLLAMSPDHPAERAYLDMLAARLGIDKALAADLEQRASMALVEVR